MSDNGTINSLSIPTPEPFSFNIADWENWIRRFERFRVVSGLIKQEENLQVETLLYLMGPQADVIVDSLKLSTDDLKSYSTVKDKLNSHFLPKTNVIFERARFNQRVQQLGEPAEQFINDLHKLAETCKFKTLKDELIRDRIVVGIRDAKLSENLQLCEDLTLSKAIEKVKASELIASQQKTVRGAGESQVAKVHNEQRFKRGGHSDFKKGNSNPCYKCGHQSHTGDSCPAKNATCKKCGKVGHFARVCKSKDPKSGNGKSDSKGKPSDSNKSKRVSSLFIGSICEAGDPWVAKVTLGSNFSFDFMLDCGSDITCIPESLYHRDMGRLRECSSKTTGPAGDQLAVVGRFCTSLGFEGTKVSTDVYVIKGLTRPLLGRPVLEPLGVVRRIYNLSRGDKSGVWREKFPELFEGLGTMPGEYSISLREGALPFSVGVPRRVPLPLLPEVKLELERMEKEGVVKKVVEPTDWCAPMVVVPKSSGRVRITTDFTALNKAVRRPKYELPSVDDTLAKLNGAKFFTKLDANSGFFQCILDKESAPLTTFITPYGRYQYLRLPMGITSAPEIYSQKMASILDGLEGVSNLMDDICVSGKSEEEHDQRLHAVLSRLRDVGVTLNPDKCEFSVQSMTYLGHLVSEHGISPDPEKTDAIVKFPAPTNVTEVRRFLGMVNQLAKFIPNISEITAPIRLLLGKSTAWCWESQQEKSFQDLKRILLSAEVLCHYDRDHPTRVATDASQHGLGGVLLQEKQGIWRPVAYASRSLTPAESRYAAVEKEALAVTWGCERFAQYLVGKYFEIQTDHRPLVSLLGKKRLDELPVRIQRFRIRLFRFSYDVTYVPGRNQASADALSRAPVDCPLSIADIELASAVEEFAVNSVVSLPASEKRFIEIREGQKVDPIISKVRDFCLSGWPKDVPQEFRSYYSVSAELSIVDDLLLKGSRLVVPASLRKDVMQRIHEGHQGMVKCLDRVRMSVWWPNVNSEVKDFIARCNTCCLEKVNKSEPMMATSFPDRPWQVVGTDLFKFKGSDYLVMVDYYSRYIELALLTSTSSSQVILHMKSVFARHGIPEIVRSDGGPQYTSYEFGKFSQLYGFEHITSSPYYAQSNGEAERAVKTLKGLLVKASAADQDLYLSLLAYRSTPLANGYSPSQLLMGRNLRSTLPQISKLLEPSLPNGKVLREREGVYRDKMKRNYDKRHRVKDLEKLEPGEQVYLKNEKKHYTVIRQHNSPRSYLLRGPDGDVKRRNRKQIVQVSEAATSQDPVPAKEAQEQPVVQKPQETVIHQSVKTEIPRRSARRNKGTLPARYRD